LDHGIAIVVALVVWWFSTGAVLYLIGMPRQTFPVSMTTATAAAGLALLGVWLTASDESVAAAYLAFASGRKTPCPDNTGGWRRMVLATETLIYHEVAILATAAVLFALTWGAPNQVGLATFMILWLARLSAKLNVFFGVPNLTEEFLPRHLEYLKTYFRRKPMNFVFPISVTLTTAATMLFVMRAVSDAAAPFEVAGYTLLAALTALAVVEHWFLVLPFEAGALWRWGLKSRQREEEKITPRYEACAGSVAGNI
jgi:hypothetical protein